MKTKVDLDLETIIIDKDIKVFYVTAKSFPDGIMDAHKKLHDLTPETPGRRFFGVSRPENGEIVYRAAAEEMRKGEAEKLNFYSLVLKKGKYVCATIEDYMKDITSIEKTFKKLLTHPDLDPNGYCVEWYFNGKDVRCMIRLKE